MESKTKHTAFRMLILIAPQKQAKKAEELFRKGNLSMQYRCNAKGTASSEIMDMLGLGNIDKILLISMMPKMFADKMLEKLHTECGLHTANSGIAFTIPLTGANHLLLHQLKQMDTENTHLNEREDTTMNESKNVLITAIVNRGFSETVMEAARSAGAKGGTVVNSRQIGNEEVSGFWGMTVQEEKEIVMILADACDKVEIMREISENCGVHSEAHGIVMSMPIDTVIGI